MWLRALFLVATPGGRKDPWTDKKKRPPLWRGRACEILDDYLAETGAGAGAGAALGQQEAANSEATAAMTASLAIFISVFSCL